MKEKYWVQFMVSGRVDDYLLYRAENVEEILTMPQMGRRI